MFIHYFVNLRANYENQSPDDLNLVAGAESLRVTELRQYVCNAVSGGDLRNLDTGGLFAFFNQREHTAGGQPHFSTYG